MPLKHSPIDLDEMMPPERAREWLRMEDRDFDEKVRKETIPVFKIGHKTRRFHPRTIIAKLAKDAGVPMDVIAASFGINIDRK